VPGAGSYNHPDTVVVKNKNLQHANFKSKADKGLDLIIGKGNPGVGEYETAHHKAVGNKEFQGGAANNFVLFTRQNYQSRGPEIKQAPRIAPLNVETTPDHLGPGSYLNKDKKDFNSMFKVKHQN
jgi:hypothetical protein